MCLKVQLSLMAGMSEARGKKEVLVQWQNDSKGLKTLTDWYRMRADIRWHGVDEVESAGDDMIRRDRETNVPASDVPGS